MSCSGAFPHGLASSLVLAIKVGSTNTVAAGLINLQGSGGVMAASGEGSVDACRVQTTLLQVGFELSF